MREELSGRKISLLRTPNPPNSLSQKPYVLAAQTFRRQWEEYTYARNHAAFTARADQVQASKRQTQR
jgi:hypothetical protein